jgi:hypothetical protein
VDIPLGIHGEVDWELRLCRVDDQQQGNAGVEGGCNMRVCEMSKGQCMVPTLRVNSEQLACLPSLS